MIYRLIITTLLLSLETRCHYKGTSDAHTTRGSQEKIDQITGTMVEQTTSASKNKLEGKIVGGELADPREFPSIVQFFNLGSMCGGSILTVRTIFTAAHCFVPNTDLGFMKVAAGARFVHDPLAQAFLVWEFVIHDEYNKGFVFSNDIAVVMILGQFQFGPFVQKAVLIDNTKFMDKKNKFRVAGYGKTQYNERPYVNTQLMKTYLSYVFRKKCAKLNNVQLGPGMFCLHGKGKRDTCQGDSGGGVLWRNMTVGVVSFGEGCAKKPGVYVNVQYYRQWLKDAVLNLGKAYCRVLRKYGADWV